jgi:MYXO-CTERM domain-containing protein
MLSRLSAVTYLTTLSYSSLAATLEVDPNGGAEFASIQPAIDAAVSGDSITLAPGTYNERVVIAVGGIEITGVDGAASTSIVGDGLAPLFTIQPDTDALITLTGLTLTNTGDSAIYATGTSLDIDGVIIVDSGALDIDGGAIYSYQSTISMGDSTITDSIGFNGGAIHLDASSITLSDCELSNNSGEFGGAIYGAHESSITDEGSSFSYNSSIASGGALYFENLDDQDLPPNVVSLSGSTVTGNSSGLYGGAIATFFNGQVTIDNSTITHNYAYDDGAGLFIYYLYGEVNISNSTISNNTGQYNTGGGIYAYAYTDLFIENSTINQNASYSHGGGIYAYNRCEVDITGSNISYNASGLAGGGLFVQSGYDTDPLYLSDTTFVGNVSDYEAGGVVVKETDSVEIYRNVFSRNSAGDDSPGGGLFIRYSDTLSVANNLFYANDGGFGGGLAVDGVDQTVGPYSLTNNIFQENIGAYGGGLFVHGAPRPEGTAEFGSHWGNETEEIVDFYVEETIDAISGDWVAHVDYDYSNCTDDAYSVFDGVVNVEVNEQPIGGSIWINSSDPNAEIGVRLRDGEGETFWYYIGTVLGTGWIQYNLSDYNSFPSNSNWSGNDDGIFDPPLTKVGVQIYGNNGNSGTIQFDNVNMQYELAGPIVVADYEQPDYVILAHNNTFVGNIGLDYGAGVAAANTAIDLTNNAFASNSGAAVIEYMDSDSERTSINRYNGWFENTPVTEGLAGEGAVSEDPAWANYERDSTPANDNFTLLVGSPYVNAGMVEISDPNSGRSDIGSNGGPGAIWVDEDGDGFTTMDDCDDTDSTINPKGADVWYDGINSDCMVGSDYDQDGDGFDSMEFTPDEAGSDCDDNDASVTDDCSGDLIDDDEPAECGCSADSKGNGSWLGFLALAGIALRRRS